MEQSVSHNLFSVTGSLSLLSSIAMCKFMGCLAMIQGPWKLMGRCLKLDEKYT